MSNNKQRVIVMKKIFSTLIFASAAIFSFTQDHLSFKGVPIDGTLSAFVDQLEKSGFELLDTRDVDIPWDEIFSGNFSALDEKQPFNRAEILKEGYATLKGDFAGYKNCKVNVSTLEDKDLVSSVMVSFPDRDTWSTLSSDYFDLKEMLTTKYGNPSKSNEEWKEGEPSGDDYKMYAVGDNECKYESTFETDKGTIRLAIYHDNSSFWDEFVMLTYIDKINSRKVKAKALGDL